MKLFRCLLIAIFFVFAVIPLFDCWCKDLTPPTNVVQANDSFKPVGSLQEEQIYDKYVVRIYRRNDMSESSLEILKDGKLVHILHGHFFSINSIYEKGTGIPMCDIGTDITGDGEPNLVVSEWTGGAHCCFNLHIFQIGRNFRHIDTIEAGHSQDAIFENHDDSPGFLIIVQDWTFAYWNTCFCQSPAPSIILKYDGEGFSVAPELMKKKPPENFQILAKRIKTLHWKNSLPPVELWKEMLDLIYTGNASSAWTLIDLVWPKKLKGKEKFVSQFRNQLKESPYYGKIAKLNSGDYR